MLSMKIGSWTKADISSSCILFYIYMWLCIVHLFMTCLYWFGIVGWTSKKIPLQHTKRVFHEDLWVPKVIHYDYWLGWYLWSKPVRGTTSPWRGILLLKRCILSGRGGCSERTCPHWRRKLLGRAGRGPPTFWPLWAAHRLGPPTFSHKILKVYCLSVLNNLSAAMQHGVMLNTIKGHVFITAYDNFHQ